MSGLGKGRALSINKEDIQYRGEQRFRPCLCPKERSDSVLCLYQGILGMITRELWVGSHSEILPIVPYFAVNKR